MKSRQPPVTGKRAGAFTLMELMVVVGIIGLVAAMSMPSILQMRHEAPMRKAINDVMEIFERARAGAVLKDTTTTVIFAPRDGSFEVENGDDNAALSIRVGKGPVLSAKLDPSVTIEKLIINLRDCTEAAAVPMKFKDNGTCDEMTMILSCDGQHTMVTMDPITALPTFKQL
jgi:prepilin-type N-terminal cleavage/methylation domain-containing protein